MESVLAPYVRTSHPFVLLRTWEADRIIAHEVEAINKSLEEAGSKIRKRMLVWDCLEGLREYGRTVPSVEEAMESDNPSTDPVVAIGLLRDRVMPKPSSPNKAKQKGEKHIVCFYRVQSGDRYLESEQWMQVIDSTAEIFKRQGVTVVFVSPTMQIATGSPLSHRIKTINSSLPSDATLQDVIDDLLKSQKQIAKPDTESMKLCVEALKGLTKMEASDAVALSLVHDHAVTPERLFRSKQAQIEGTGALRILSPAEFTLDNLGGLKTLKSYCNTLLTAKMDGKARPRGVLLLGVPGTGKTHFCRALGSAVNRPVVQLDLTAVRNKYVGESERILRDTLEVLKSIGSCILFIDEIEKQINGGGGGGEDGGSSVDNGVLALMLQFLDTAGNYGIFTVATCNNIKGLPPEFKRSGRWNGTFFIDIPTAEQKTLIWDIWCNYHSAENIEIPNDQDWCGSDIRNCCEQAELLGVSLKEAAEFVTPLIISSPESLHKLRGYAENRCIDANVGGRYSKKNTDAGASNGESDEGKGTPKAKRRPRRKVNIDEGDREII